MFLLQLPGMSLDCSDPQLSLLRITGWEAEETDPLDLALLFDTAVVAANHAAPVQHGKLAMVIKVWRQRPIIIKVPFLSWF